MKEQRGNGILPNVPTLVVVGKEVVVFHLFAWLRRDTPSDIFPETEMEGPGLCPWECTVGAV